MKSYVQIGSNRGNDHFFRYVSSLSTRSKIVLVEPNGRLIDGLKECYRTLEDKHEILIFNNGIVHDTSIDTLIIHSGGDALSSVIHRKSHPYFESEMKFCPMTFDQLCSAAGVEEIEELHIDTEGYDYTILNSIDFALRKIERIECEVWPYDVDSTDTIKTGPTFFRKILWPKLSMLYGATEKTTDGMLTHLFVRKQENSKEGSQK